MESSTKPAKKNRRTKALPAAILLTVLLTVLLSAGCGARTEPSSQAEPVEQQEAPAQTEPAAQQEASPQADPVRISTDVAEPREGCAFFEVEGRFEEPDRDAVLQRLNEIRLEACREGVMNPTTGDPLTEADYVPLAWSADLERTARLRAAEATVREDHMRPNGLDCFTVEFDGMRANYETLAWGYGSIAASVDGWYSEKEAYTEEAGGVASHYVALITPENVTVGAAGFTPADGGRDACAAELAMLPEEADPAEAPAETGPYGACIQIIEVTKELLTQLR